LFVGTSAVVIVVGLYKVVVSGDIRWGWLRWDKRADVREGVAGGGSVDSFEGVRLGVHGFDGGGAVSNECRHFGSRWFRRLGLH